MKSSKENLKTQKQKVSKEAILFALMLTKYTNELKKQTNEMKKKLKMKKNFPRTAQTMSSTTEDILSL